MRRNYQQILLQEIITGNYQEKLSGEIISKITIKRGIVLGKKMKSVTYLLNNRYFLYTINN